jgi:hypothetical protein
MNQSAAARLALLLFASCAKVVPDASSKRLDDTPTADDFTVKRVVKQ